MCTGRQVAAGLPEAKAVMSPLRKAGAGAFDAPAARRAPRRARAPERGSGAQQPLAGAVAAIRGAPLESCTGAAGRGAPADAGSAADVVPEIVMQLRRAPLTAAVSLPVGDTLLPSPQELARALAAAPPAPLQLAPVAAAAGGPATASADDEPLYRRASVGASVSARELPGQPGADGAAAPGSRHSSRDGPAGRATDLALPSGRLQQQQQRALEQRADPGIGARLRRPNGLRGGARRRRRRHAQAPTPHGCRRPRGPPVLSTRVAPGGGCLQDRQAPCHSSGRRARRAATRARCRPALRLRQRARAARAAAAAAAGAMSARARPGPPRGPPTPAAGATGPCPGSNP